MTHAAISCPTPKAILCLYMAKPQAIFAIFSTFQTSAVKPVTVKSSFKK
jgi:hypothetical protein